MSAPDWKNAPRAMLRHVEMDSALRAHLGIGAWVAETPVYRIEPQILNVGGVESRVYSILRKGETVATTNHADIAQTILKALEKQR